MRILLASVCLSVLAMFVCGAANTSPTATISGRVVDAETGAPLAQVSVSARWEPNTYDYTHTDKQGRFSIDVPVGEVRLHWSIRSPLYEGEPLTKLPAVNVPRKGIKSYTIKVPRLQVVTGEVHNESGRLAEGASITVGPRGYNLGAITDNRGRFVLILPSQRRTSPG